MTSKIIDDGSSIYNKKYKKYKLKYLNLKYGQIGAADKKIEYVNISSDPEPSTKTLFSNNFSDVFKPLYGGWIVSMDLNETKEDIRTGSENLKKINLDENIIKGKYRLQLDYDDNSGKRYYFVCGKHSEWTTLGDFINDISQSYNHVPLKFFPQMKKFAQNPDYIDWRDFTEHLHIDGVNVEDINDNANIITLNLGS